MASMGDIFFYKDPYMIVGGHFNIDSIKSDINFIMISHRQKHIS